MNRRKFFASLAGIPFIGAAIAKIASEPSSPQELAKAIADRMVVWSIDPAYEDDSVAHMEYHVGESEPLEPRGPWFQPSKNVWYTFHHGWNQVV